MIFLCQLFICYFSAFFHWLFLYTRLSGYISAHCSAVVSRYPLDKKKKMAVETLTSEKYTER